MKVGNKEADRFCNAPGAGVRIVLVHGPDRGLVRERSDALARSAIEDLSDPFCMTELSGDAVANDPAALIDAAGSISLTGGRQVVRIKAATDKAGNAIDALLESPTGDTLVVIEAGELPARSRLRRSLEKPSEKAAAVVACYRDEGRGLLAVINDELKRHDISADPGVAQLLAASLGSDRLQTRNEVAKLALYVGPGGTVTTDDVDAVVADSSFLSLDRVAYAVSAGRLDDLDRSLERALADQEGAVSILMAVIRHMTQLGLFLSLMDRGKSEAEALKSARTFHFRVDDALRAARRHWNAGLANRAVDHLIEAEIRCKTTGMPADVICRRALFDVARTAARRAR